MFAEAENDRWLKLCTPFVLQQNVLESDKKGRDKKKAQMIVMRGGVNIHLTILLPRASVSCNQPLTARRNPTRASLHSWSAKVEPESRRLTITLAGSYAIYLKFCQLLPTASSSEKEFSTLKRANYKGSGPVVLFTLGSGSIVRFT